MNARTKLKRADQARKRRAKFDLKTSLKRRRKQFEEEIKSIHQREKDSENTRFSYLTSSEPVPDPFGQEAIRKLARENADLLAQIAELQANQKPIQ